MAEINPNVLREALNDIANYILPVYNVEGHGLMVELKNVYAIKLIAREALGLKENKS